MNSIAYAECKNKRVILCLLNPAYTETPNWRRGKFYRFSCMMSSISLHPMPEFNPDTEVGASLAARWKTWLADFDMFLAPLGITDTTRKRALLLYQAGARVREIFAQLDDTGNADVFDTAKQKLTAYFEPQKNRRHDVYIFRKAFQGHNETADLDFELEEQIIIGGLSSRIRKQALRDPKYDLKAMLLDGRRDEMSKFQSKEIEGKPEFREETNQVSVVARKCRNCGSTHNHNSPCPAQGLECHHCGKPNHFAKVCRSKSKAGRKPTKPPHRKPARAQSRTTLKPLTHSDPTLILRSIYILCRVNKRLGHMLKSPFRGILSILW